MAAFSGSKRRDEFQVDIGWKNRLLFHDVLIVRSNKSIFHEKKF
jgi:hypothetical protein